MQDVSGCSRLLMMIFILWLYVNIGALHEHTLDDDKIKPPITCTWKPAQEGVMINLKKEDKNKKINAQNWIGLSPTQTWQSWQWQSFGGASFFW